MIYGSLLHERCCDSYTGFWLILICIGIHFISLKADLQSTGGDSRELRINMSFMYCLPTITMKSREFMWSMIGMMSRTLRRSIGLLAVMPTCELEASVTLCSLTSPQTIRCDCQTTLHSRIHVGQRNSRPGTLAHL